MKQTMKTLIPLAMVFAFLVATNVMYAAWSAPTGAPSAANNTPAPINVGIVDQVKNAALGVDGLAVFGTASIQTEVRSPKYCDENGTNCFSTATATATVSNPIISKYGEGNRCVSDDFIAYCGYNPTQPWNHNTCYGRGHSEQYGWNLIWDNVAGGYVTSDRNEPGDVICARGTSASLGTWGNWVDVTSSRPKQVWHQNTTGKGLAVSYRSRYGVPEVYVSPTGSDTDRVIVYAGDGDSGEHGPGFFIVPPGHYYFFSRAGTMLHVSELTLPF